MQIDLTWNLFLTAVGFPLACWWLKRVIHKSDKSKEKLEVERDKRLDERHQEIKNTITKFCEKNEKDHKALWWHTEGHGHRVDCTEKGCDVIVETGNVVSPPHIG